MSDRIHNTSQFLIASDLWPGDAQTVRMQLVEWLATEPDDATVELDSDQTEASVSALQLLVAATRRTSGTPPALGEKAAAAVVNLTTSQIMKQDS